MKRFENYIQELVEKIPVPFCFELPNGHKIGVKDADLLLRCKTWGALRSLAKTNCFDFGEAYVKGNLEMDGNIRDFMRLMPMAMVRQDKGDRLPWWSVMFYKWRSKLLHSLAQDQQKIQFHYDLSDDFYALWLDPSRAYSCAYYPHDNATLQQAQEAKFEHICRKLMLKPGQQFLDIGAGWGGLLLWAAKHYDIQATGITLSNNQLTYVNRLIEEQGLQGKVRMVQQDYRQLPADQTFDRIASVGMFEHVGRDKMLGYFKTIHRLLKPDGLVLNHGITLGNPAQANVDHGISDFIDQYIFPGGELLHISDVMLEMSAAKLEAVDAENLRPHYARTLWAWSDALEANLDAALKIVTPERLRAYRLYLAASAIGFEENWMQLFQVLGKPVAPHLIGLPREQEYPFRRDYMYR